MAGEEGARPRKPDGSPAEMAEAGALVAYFGYGSLVNRATHRTAIVHAAPARLRGWRRCWRPRPDMPGFPAALLTIRRDATATCDGLLVIDRAENLAAVDAREARYRRVRIDPRALECADPFAGACPAYVYVAHEDAPPHREPPRILRSYLDAVLQGFLAEHGEDGLRRFLAETEGFETPIHDDRQSPLYPRSVALSEAERRVLDLLVAARAAGAAMLSPVEIGALRETPSGDGIGGALPV